jgi:hypothetical protein
MEAIQKNRAYLNEMYNRVENPFYLEFILDGFLFIMRDFKCFKQFRDSDLFQEKLDSVMQDEDPRPSHGIKFFIRCECIPSRFVYPIFRSNFAQVDRSIKVTMAGDGQITLWFRTYRSFDLYARVTKIFTQELEALPPSIMN